MKNPLLFILISSAIIVNSGCSSKLMSFEKRRYNKGYHVDFAERKNNKIIVADTKNVTSIPKQETKEIITADLQKSCQPVPEICTNLDRLNEEGANDNEPAISFVSTEKKKHFQIPLLNKKTGTKIKSGVKNSINNFIPAKNTAGVNQTMNVSFFTILGGVIAGGSLVALVVMLFSGWASVLFLILLISGIVLGLLLLIVGANT